MTIPEKTAKPRYMLFSSGAAFSCALLDSLLDLDYPPELIVLPEYPPAPHQNDLLRVEPSSAFRARISGLELAYAPREQQRETASSLRQRNVDYLLVACWPYLIGADLRQSVLQAALNLHPSLLPRFRGPDPIGDQIDSGDSRFGVSLHLLDDRFDHGDIVDQAAIELEMENPDRDYVEARCAEQGARMFVDAVQAGRSAWRIRLQGQGAEL